jgi:hypothetical protein
MPLVQIKINEYGCVPSDLALNQREWNRLKTLAWTLVGEHWHEKMRPKHFTRQGAQEYNYQPRTEKYAIRKAVKYGQSEPLVYTGETRDLSQEKNIHATNKGVRVTFPSLRKLNQYKPTSGIDLTEEFQTVSQEEIEELTELWVHQMENFLRGFRGGGVRTIGNRGG